MAATKRTSAKKAASAAPPGPGEEGYVKATETLYPETGSVDASGRTIRSQSVGQLAGDAYVAAKTDPDATADGNFRKSFTVSRKWTSMIGDDMHRANCVATLQEALNRGVHPKGEAYLEAEHVRGNGDVELVYAVTAVPAGEDEEPGTTYTPAAALRDMGGSTLEHAQRSQEFGTASEHHDSGGVSI